MHGHAARLVNDQQFLVLEQNRRRQPIAHRLRRRNGRRAALCHRRNTQRITGREPRRRLDPALVDAHLALAQHPVDPPARHAGQFTRQVVVDPLPVVLFANRHVAHRAHHLGRLLLFFGQ